MSLDFAQALRSLETEYAACAKAVQATAVAGAKLDAAVEARRTRGRTLEEAGRHGQERYAELVRLRAELKEARTASDAIRAKPLPTVKPRSRGPLPPARGALKTRRKP
ncbi:hypothetical protein V4C53_43635 [Paraburkholderia azotifigens]|uniref:hypothetical protein n=1 Tax=Paraburkholderia azotifigens TaxID=2057004 RepID=UPI00317677DC